MSVIEVNLDDSAFQDDMKAITDLLSDLSELCSLLAGRALKLIDRKFQKSGPGWVPLSEKTLKRRRKGGAGAKPLLDTGHMRRSLVSGGPDGVYEVSAFGFSVGTLVKYAPAHQFGTSKIPARPFIPDELELVAEFTPLIKRYFKDKLS